ncbi:MAG: lipid-A-disaccharide synthase [Porphyromonadaceae bacterium CG2_30_38_12]|nr:MAG: lipid-A-disaccharide synthase [Porphyromonadaceae bacterium CG2_30_38_12]
MRYFLIAGEASGDLHAANLMQAIKVEDADAKFCFLGGDLMQAQGGKLITHYRDMAFMGFVAVVRNLKTILQNIQTCKKAISDFKPDLVILIDYPSFNLRIAKYVKKTSTIPVYYYIPPKLWAWKEYRIKEIRQFIDQVFTIFPFETAFYAKHNYRVHYVGNPVVDAVAARPLKNESQAEFCKKNQLTGKPIIALLAGSRKQEIRKCLPRMMNAAALFTDYQTVVAGAPGIESDFYKTLLHGKDIPVLYNQTYQLIQQARVAVVNSGTATLETALIGTPQVVVYHVMFGRVAYIAKELFLKVTYISLVNILSGHETVKELIAHLFTEENICHEINKILTDASYEQAMRNEYKRIATELGEPSTAIKAARLIVALLNKTRNQLP